MMALSDTLLPLAGLMGAVIYTRTLGDHLRAYVSEVADERTDDRHRAPDEDKLDDVAQTQVIPVPMPHFGTGEVDVTGELDRVWFRELRLEAEVDPLTIIAAQPLGPQTHADWLTEMVVEVCGVSETRDSTDVDPDWAYRQGRAARAHVDFTYRLTREIERVLESFDRGQPERESWVDLVAGQEALVAAFHDHIERVTADTAEFDRVFAELETADVT